MKNLNLKTTLILGAAFFVLMLLIDGVSNRLSAQNGISSTPTKSSAPAGNAPVDKTPAAPAKTK